MSKQLDGRIALVTGGSRGIGRACAVALGAEGARVVVGYAGSRDRAHETVATIEAQGGAAMAVQIDVRDSEAIKTCVADIVKTHGRLDIAVANAGISIDGLLVRTKDVDLEEIFRTNAFGAFYTARAAARPMMKARSGRIIFMGSVVGSMGNVGQAAYAASKSALEGMGKSLARELASRKVTVNVVAPGFIATDMTDAMPEEARQSTEAAIPLREIGRPEDIAGLVGFLASDRARYITGQVIGVNGGLYM